MGSVNVGNQIQTVKYYAPVNSDVVNRRRVGIETRGIYSGGFLTKVNDSSVEVSPLVCEIGDDTNQLRIETQSAVTVSSVSSSTPYIVLRWAYVASVNNYMDILAVATPADNDLVVGKAIYSGSTLTGFDYSDRTFPMKFKDFLKVVPTETPSMKVHIKAGWCTYGSRKLVITEQDSSFTIPVPASNPRIDYVYVDENGAVQLEQGNEAASPTAEDYRGRIVLAEIYVTPSTTAITEDNITDVRGFIGGAAGSVSGSAVQVGQTAHGFSVGEVLRWDNVQNKYVRAQADSTTNANAIGMVSAVPDTDSFTLTLLGKVSGLSGLTAGSLYYLSDSVAGAITTTEPTAKDHVSKPVLIAISATEGYFFNWRGLTQPFGGGGATKDVTQTAHGFAKGDIVRWDSGASKYVKAKADSATNAEVIGIVSDVVDANNFTITLVGYVSGLSGLTAGSVYFLSDTTDGALTSTEPTTDGSISKPLLVAISSTEGYFFNWRGVELTSNSVYITSFTNSDLSSGVLTVGHNLGHKYCQVTVYDNNDKKVLPDEIILVDNNTLQVDLSSYGTISGTWHVAVFDIGGDSVNAVGRSLGASSNSLISRSPDASAYADISDMSLDITTIRSNQPVLIWFTATYSISDSGVDNHPHIKFALYVDSGIVKEVPGQKHSVDDTTGLVDSVSLCYRHVFATPGTYTIKIQWKAIGTTAAIYSAQRSLVILKD